MKQHLLIFCFAISNISTIAQVQRLTFYSKYIIPYKTDTILKNIEDKLLFSLDEAKKNNKRPTYHIYADSDWRMEFTLNELFLNGTATPTTNYELMMAWNQTVDSGFVTGYTKVYSYPVIISSGKSLPISRTLRAIPLGEYKQFINSKECILLSEIIKSDLIKQWQIKKSGIINFSYTPIKIDDSLSTYNTAILLQLSDAIIGNTSYGEYPLYNNPELTKKMTNSDIDNLQISWDTINVKDDKGVSYETYLKSEYNMSFFEIVNQWTIKLIDQSDTQNKSTICPLLTVNRSISAIEIVFNKKRAFLSYDDLKKICLSNKLDFKIYENLFNKKTIEEISIKFN